MPGHIHPLSQVIRKVTDVFIDLGFSVVQGPEVETEENNFDRLNVPKDHPAREMHDTFFLEPKEDHKLLRTHTSPVQIRYMMENKPPIKIVVPGRVFRYEATDATHEVQFYQIEGLWVDNKVSLADLKGTLTHFLSKFFGQEIAIRLRPSYFPFVEQGVEIDMSCFKCSGKGCPICKQTGWIEIMGAGMVHPYVLNSCGINPRDYQGFAFGVGVDRIAMLKYGIDDIRLFYSGDLRLINQF